LDKGFVRLVGYSVDLVDAKPDGFDDHCARNGFTLPDGHTLDAQIVRAARVSYGAGTKSVRDDAKLIKYLLRHEHGSPFEMVEFKFHVKAPIFVARQWFRHRTASVNEVSGRYSVVPEEFYIPQAFRLQDTKNRQGSTEALDESTNAHALDAYTETIDYEGLVQTAKLAVYFLDNVLTVEKAPLDDIVQAIANKRRIGLGLMSLADTLIKLGMDLDDAQFKDYLQKAKVVNFALIYGDTAYTLVRNFGFSKQEANQLIAGYFEAYPQVKHLAHLPERAHPGCAFVVKEAIVKMSRRFAEEGLDAQVIFQVHDEVGVLARLDCADRVAQVMLECMERDLNGVRLQSEPEFKLSMSKTETPLALELLEGIVEWI
jgi:flavin-dependent thymidylate synthase